MFNLQLYLCWLLWVQMLLYNMSELYLYIHRPITHHTSVLRMQPYTPSRKGADMKPRCISDWYPLQTEEAMNIFNIHLEGRCEKRIHHSILKKKSIIRKLCGPLAIQVMVFLIDFIVHNKKHSLFLSSRLHLVLSFRGNKKVVESVLKIFKSRSVVRLLLPAHHHDIVQFLWTVVWTWHPVWPV